MSGKRGGFIWKFWGLWRVPFYVFSGMSTAAEVVVARHCGLRVFGLSLITNKVTKEYGTKEHVEHHGVLAVSQKRASALQRFLTELVGRLDSSTNGSSDQADNKAIYQNGVWKLWRSCGDQVEIMWGLLKNSWAIFFLLWASLTKRRHTLEQWFSTLWHIGKAFKWLAINGTIKFLKIDLPFLQFPQHTWTPFIAHQWATAQWLKMAALESKQNLDQKSRFVFGSLWQNSLFFPFLLYLIWP